MKTRVDPALAGLLQCKYVENGRDIIRDGGLDCWGFIRECWKRLGRGDLPLNAVSDKKFHEIAFKDAMNSPEWRKVDCPVPFCLAVFFVPRYGYHVGLVLSSLTHFLHCRVPMSTIDALDDGAWARCLKGYYEYNAS